MGFGLKLGFTLTLVIFAFTSCSPKHDELTDLASDGITLNPNPDPALEAAATNLLSSRCVSCHGISGNDPRFLNTVSNPGTADLAQNTTYVRIGQAQISRLFQRSNDGSMPPGNPITSNEADVIKAWIDDLGIVPEGGGGNPDAASFTEVETQILAPRCYNCHTNGAGANAGFPFSNYNDLLFGYVTPGSLDSALYLSVSRALNPMPRGGPPLSSTEIDMIESWILNGAPNN